MGISSVVVVLVLFAAVQAALWVTLLLWLRSRTASLKRALWDECIRAGEIVTLRPRTAVFRGSAAGGSMVRGNGVLIVTEKRLIFRKLFGRGVEIARSEIAGVSDRLKRLPRSAKKASGEVVVIHTNDRNQFSFLLPDADVLRRALAQKIFPGPA